MTGYAPQIDDNFLRELLTRGTLEAFANCTKDERLRAQLKLVRFKLSKKRVAYIDAQVDVLCLIDMEYDDEAVRRRYVEKHYLGVSELAHRIARRGAGKKITGPAKAIFRQLKADPAAFEQRCSAIKLKMVM
ncbi:hypothetical protein [Bradyrhizobium sp. 174]|uniref:hypothetical protein n=1 Tax=Bradyrhizobium sp. 174 TaxID=2782645 RepID=UPI001FF9CEC9|nr:hypothetical protein [Bradyrhizobium sp. 174]MCK1570328.1 hypothetical protein [Bradyrhizobium sp. 174]